MEKRNIILLNISLYRIALPVEICTSVNLYSNSAHPDVFDITSTIFKLDSSNFDHYLKLKGNKIISFSDFIGIINMPEIFIEIPENIFYNKIFSCLFYHKEDKEYYALLEYSYYHKEDGSV